MIKKCKTCGGEIFFNPKRKGNECKYCGALFPVEYKYNFVKKDFSESEPLETDNFAKSIKNVKCKGCGAQIIFNKYEVQSECPYCGNVSFEEGAKAEIVS